MSFSFYKTIILNDKIEKGEKNEKNKKKRQRSY